MNNRQSIGHLSALFTILIWGNTFISTKILLEAFAPAEILFLRFLIGFLILFLLSPKPMRNVTAKQRLTFAAAGLCGICLYYLLENIALTYTLASNVGVIVSIAPFFTAITAHFMLKNEEKFGINFFVGFLFAIAGIFLISFNGSSVELNPAGDLLSVAAAAVWSFYAVFSKQISTFGFSTVQVTRQCFFYGILFMIPAMFFLDFNPNMKVLSNPVYLGNLLFLSVGASAICFVTWNFSVKILGALKTSVYIYLGPVITVIASALILQEQLTVFTVTGTLLTLAGLIVSEQKKSFRRS